MHLLLMLCIFPQEEEEDQDYKEKYDKNREIWSPTENKFVVSINR